MVVRLAEKMVAAAGARQRRSQFAPYQTVGNYDERARRPAQQGLRAAHGSHHQRNGDERPDVNHVGDIQSRAWSKPKARVSWGDVSLFVAIDGQVGALQCRAAAIL